MELAFYIFIIYTHKSSEKSKYWKKRRTKEVKETTHIEYNFNLLGRKLSKKEIKQKRSWFNKKEKPSESESIRKGAKLK